MNMKSGSSQELIKSSKCVSGIYRLFIYLFILNRQTPKLLAVQEDRPVRFD